MSSLEPSRIIWDRVNTERHWRYWQQFPETYFSFHLGKDLVWQANRYLAKGARVLDYGCGPGYLIPPLLDAGYVVTGADLSTETIGQRVPDVKAHPKFSGFYTISDLIEKGEKFDAAFLIEVVEHLHDPELNETFENLRQLLRPGGTLVITTPNDEDLSKGDVYCPVSNTVFHKWQHVRSWTGKTLSNSLEKAGYSVEQTRLLNFRSNRSMSSPHFRLFGSMLAKYRTPVSLMAVAINA